MAEEARFCPECGRALAADPGILDAPFFDDASRRRLGVQATLLLAALLVGAGGALLATGRWFGSLVLLAAAALAAGVYGRLSGRGSLAAIADVRERAVVTREAMAARSRQQVVLFRARRDLADRESERARLYRTLGEAAYRGDDGGAATARRALDEVHAEITAKEEEIEALKRETEERVESARATVQPTERLQAPAGPAGASVPPAPGGEDEPEPPSTMSRREAPSGAGEAPPAGATPGREAGESPPD